MGGNFIVIKEQAPIELQGSITETRITEKPEGFAKTLEFLKIALAEGAHLNKPPKISQDQWTRDKNITGIYWKTEETQEEIARRYNLSSKQAINQIIHNTIRRIWNNSSTHTQTLFPFEELVFRKPLPLKSRERRSLLSGGRSVLLRDSLASGKTIEEIRESGIELSKYRERLKRWGFDIPYISTGAAQNIELEIKLINAKTDREKQELLDQVKIVFYRKHVKGENPLLTAVRNAILESGFRPNFQDFIHFVNTLQSKGFPMSEIKRLVKGKTVTYYFFLTQDKQRAQAIWLRNQDLQKFQVGDKR